MRCRKFSSLKSGLVMAGIIEGFLFAGNADAAAPSVTTLPASAVTTTSAILNGTVNPNGEATTAYFQYGLDTDYPTSTLVTNLPAGSGNLTVANFVDEVGFFGTAGTNWTERAIDKRWRAVASSADGSKLVAAEVGSGVSGRIYTSTDSGTNWTLQTGSPTANWRSVASSADGTKLVAVATENKIYTSTDSGVTWIIRENGYTGSPAWRSVASSSDGTKLVAVASGDQIYTSTDSGVSWVARDSIRNWRSVASSADGMKLVAGLSPGQIYTSTDSGASWTVRTNGYSSTKNWFSIASSADGTKLVAVANGDKIYTSTDSGVNWTVRDNNFRYWESVDSSEDGKKLVAVEFFGKIYTSTNSGVTWVPREIDRQWQAVACSANGSRLVAVVNGPGRIYTSEAPLTLVPLTPGTTYRYRLVAVNSSGTTLGSEKTFTTIVPPVVTTLPATSITATGATLNSTVNPGADATTAYFEYGLDTNYGSESVASSLAATTNDLSVIKPINSLRYYGTAGSNWITANLTRQNWQSVSSSADGSKLAAVVNFGEIHTSNDKGVTWTVQAGAPIGLWSSIASSADGTKLAAADLSGRIYTSTDSGVNWNTSTNGYTGFPRWFAIASSSDGSKLVAAVENGLIYTSADSGVSWTARTNGYTGSRAWYAVASSADGSRLVAAENGGGTGGRIYTSTDSGVNWTLQAGAPVKNWLSVASSSDGFKLVAVDGATFGRIYTSIDGGVNWTPRLAAPSSTTWRSVASSADGTKLFAAAYYGRIYTSLDGGVSWSPNTGGPIDTTWTCIASSSDGTRLVAAVGGNRIYTSLGPLLMPGLTPDTTYHYRIVGVNSLGTVVGDNLTFTTESAAPAAATQPATGITATTAELNGTVSPNGAPASWYFEYGPTTSYGSFTPTSLLPVPKALHFNGSTSQFATTSGDVDLSNRSFSVEFWARRAGTDRWDMPLTQGIVDSRRGLHIGFRDNNNFTFAFWDDDLDAPGYYSDNAWHHWACTYDVSNNQRLIYRDGVAIASNTAGAAYRENSPLLIARSAQLDSNFGGELDELRVWGSVRTPEQINAYINTVLTGDEADLLAYWPFNEGSGTNTVDASGNAHNATLSGSPDWIPGIAHSVVRAPVSDLDPGTLYHFRLVASNSLGTTEGNDLTFTTVAAPAVTTLAATDITPTNGMLNGTVNPGGGVTTVYFEYGQSTNYGSFTVTNTLAATTDTLSVSNVIGSLLPGMTYYYRLVANNSAGTSYGSNVSFTAAVAAPVLAYQPASSITLTTAVLNSTVNPGGAETTAYFQYGTNPISDFNNYSSTSVLAAANAALAFSKTISGLIPGTKYFYRVVASNSAGLSYGGYTNFTTTIVAPLVTTQPATGITTNSATLNGSVNPGGAETTAYFQYGTNTSYGSETVATNLPATISNLAVAADISRLKFFVTPGKDWTLRATNGGFYWYSIASSADGVKLVAASDGGNIYTSTNSGITWVARTSVTAAKWASVASSADGTKLVAAESGSVADGSIYTSTDSGANWVARTNAPLKRWSSVASSADGTKLVAAASGGGIYTSTDSGTTWVERTSDPANDWSSVASSADGTKLVAVTYDGHIYTSADSGATWAPRGGSTFWSSVASSVDGSKLVAVDSGANFDGGIHTSTDSGTTWVQQTNAPAKTWRSVASSADGTKLVAVESAGGVYTSTDSGTNWTLRTGGYIGLPGWRAVASSADGNKLVAGEYDSIYTSAGGWFTPALTPDTTYHYRLVATNRAGIRFGANMTFTTTVTPSPDFRLDLNIPLAEGTFLLTFTNVTGANFTVLATTNLLLPLVDWVVLGPPVEDPPGTYTFIDPQATNSPQRFYRVTSP